MQRIAIVIFIVGVAWFVWQGHVHAQDCENAVHLYRTVPALQRDAAELFRYGHCDESGYRLDPL